MSDGLSVKELLKLMSAMKTNNVAYMKLPGVELGMGYPAREVAATPKLPEPMNAQQAVAQIAERRKKMEELRGQASERVGLGTAKLVSDVYKDTLKTKPPQ